MSTKFRERNLNRISLTTAIVLVLMIIGSFQIAKIPFISGASYKAEFSEAGGLKNGDPVEVAGVTVGKVTKVDLDGDKVVVTFTAKHVHVGGDSTAMIKTGTLLGARYIGLSPAGSGELADDTIRLAHTTAPYDLADSLSQVAAHTSKINLDGLSKALNTFSGTLDGTRDDWGPALRGISALSKTISSRDAALRTLFREAAAVTGTFRSRTQQITDLISKGDVLMAELNARRTTIRNMIVAVSALADEVTGLIKDNQPQLAPALQQLNAVAALLQRNRDNINVTIRRAAGFITGVGEGLGSGTWFNGHVNLAPGVVGLQQFIPRELNRGGQ